MQFKEEIIINASPGIVFEKYKNVSRWKEWDSEVKESSLSGEFVAGSLGMLKPSKGPKAKFKLTEVKVNKSFTTQSKLPLCTMFFSHQIENFDTYVKVTHSVSFSGLTRFFFGRLIGGQIKKTLPDTLRGLKINCE